MADFLNTIIEFIHATQVVDQFRAVEVKALFTNIYFLVPFLAVVGHIIYRKSMSTMILLIMGFGLWIFWGSPFMDDLVVNGEMQLNKVLPVVGVGIAAIGVLAYLLFIRSD